VKHHKFVLNFFTLEIAIMLNSRSDMTSYFMFKSFNHRQWRTSTSSSRSDRAHRAHFDMYWLSVNGRGNCSVWWWCSVCMWLRVCEWCIDAISMMRSC